MQIYKLIIFAIAMLCGAGAFAQTTLFGSQNPTGLSKTGAPIQATYYSGTGIRVQTIASDGRFRDTSVASLLQDAVKYADSNLYATQYDLTTGLSGKLNTSDSTLYSTQYDLTSGLATKINTSAISQNYSDNSSATIPSSAALYNGMRTKVDTGSNGVYVYSRQQLYDALGYAKTIVIASDTITVNTIKSVPSGTTIMGLGGGRSKITATDDNTTGIFTVLSVNEVTIKDLELEGEGANVNPTSGVGSFYTTLGMAADSNIGTSRGIFVNNVQRVFIINVYAHNFTKAGIEVQNTGQTEPARMGLIVDNVFLTNNYYGIYCANNGQYNTFSNIISNYNICGFGKRAGNTTVTGQFTNNRVGYFSGFGANAAHGSISNSLINHSYLRAAYISNITSGEIITGCHVYDAGIEVVGSAGVQIYGCLLECPVTVDGVGTNIVHDNMLSLESGGGNITNTGVGSFYMYNNTSIPDRNNRTVNNDLIRRLRATSSTEIEPVDYVATSATAGMWDFRTPLQSLSGGILVAATFEGELYGVPGAKFRLDVQAYPNTTTAVAPTAYISATFTEVNGTLPFTKVSAAIAPDGQFSIRIGDTNTAVPVSRLAMTKCTFWNVGNQGNQTTYTGGKWTSRITNTNVGFTSVVNIAPKTNLNDASAINGANITDGTVTAAELASNSVTTVKVTDGNITLPKLATQLPSSIVANATGGTASPTAVSIGVGLGFSGSTLSQSFTNTRSSAGTLALQYATDYTFTGTTAIYTLPAISPVTGRENAIKVKNAGSGNITINTNGALNTLWNTTLTNTMTIAPGEAYDFVPDGVNINVY